MHLYLNMVSMNTFTDTFTKAMRFSLLTCSLLEQVPWCTSISLSIHIYIYIYKHISLCLYIYIYIVMTCIHIYIYIYIYIYMCTYIYIYIYIYICIHYKSVQEVALVLDAQLKATGQAAIDIIMFIICIIIISIIAVTNYSY